MGVIQHHAIIATSWDLKAIEDLRAKAVELFVSPAAPPSEILQDKSNGYYTLFIPPDGSKEGWPASKNGDERREAFIVHLRAARAVDWCEVIYGMDAPVPEVIEWG